MIFDSRLLIKKFKIFISKCHKTYTPFVIIFRIRI